MLVSKPASYGPRINSKLNTTIVHLPLSLSMCVGSIIMEKEEKEERKRMKIKGERKWRKEERKEKENKGKMKVDGDKE